MLHPLSLFNKTLSNDNVFSFFYFKNKYSQHKFQSKFGCSKLMQEMTFPGFKFQTFSGGVRPPDFPIHAWYADHARGLWPWLSPLTYYVTERSLFKKCPHPTGKSLFLKKGPGKLRRCYKVNRCNNLSPSWNQQLVHKSVMKYNLGATFAAAKFEQGNKYSYEDVLDIFVLLKLSNNNIIIQLVYKPATSLLRIQIVHNSQDVRFVYVCTRSQLNKA